MQKLILLVSHNKNVLSASLVVQWSRICLTVKGTCVQSLVQEDLTCQGAMKLMHHNY